MAEETKAAVMVYEARDGVEITLTFDVIRRYLVQGHPEFVVPSEFMYFMGVCKSQGMNPFKKDCYLIKYTQRDSAAIIVAIDFLRSRAKAQSDCRGWNAGIILQKGKELEYREGTLILEDEKLVGGWFEGKPAGWDKPIKWTVPLKTYLKKTREGNLTRFWETDNQPGQIAKVAESQGLKKCWPQEFQNLYTDVEISPDDEAKGLPEITEEAGQGAENETPDPDAHKDFDKKVPKDAKADQVKEFLALVQQGAEKTVFEVKQEAVDHWDEFWGSFVKWQSKNYGDEQTETVEKDPIREQYINLRGAGFSTWVHKALVFISELDTRYQKEIKAKWLKLYPDEPYPLDKPESPATDHVAPSGDDSEPDSEETPTDLPVPSEEDKIIMSIIEGSKLDIANRLCVPCPNTNGRAVLFGFCKEGCQERKGCTTFEEYDKSQLEQ